MFRSRLKLRSKALFLLPVLLIQAPASAEVILVQTSDPGFYNDSLGTVLNETNGGNTATSYFPIDNDSTVNFEIEPDLSAAGDALGNWISDPFNLNSHWTYENSIPNRWTVGTEVAVMYRFDTLGATNVQARFGVDNGIFAWLDDQYIGGGRSAGGVVLGEYAYDLGDLDAGTYFLKLLLEDHGVTNGYSVRITADTFRSVPEPSTCSLLAIGLAAATVRRRPRKNR